MLKNIGLQVDAVAGHSYGGVTALHAADVLDFDSYMKLTRRRGELMRECNDKQGGAMLAVLAPKEKVLEAIAPIDKSEKFNRGCKLQQPRASCFIWNCCSH